MKEQTKRLQQKISSVFEQTHLTAKETLEIVLTHAILAFCGFFAARALVQNRFLPFGIALVAGAPYQLMLSIGFGAIAASIFPVSEMGGFRYIAALFALLAIRLLVSKIKPLSTKPLFAFFMAFLCVFFTGIATFNGLTGGFYFSFMEAILAAGGAYFVNRGFDSILRNDTGLSGEQLCSVILSVNFILLGLGFVNIGHLSLGRFVSIVLILIAARYGNVSAGAVFGIACALTAVLAGSDTPIAIMLCFGGLMAGVFADMGKIGQTLAFLAATLIGATLASFNAQSIAVLIESLLACAVYLLMPRNIAMRFGKLFAGRVTVLKPDGLKNGLTMRLKFASKALGDVSKTVDNVAASLSKINAPDFKTVINKIENDACKGCSLQIYCWETKYDETLAAVIEMTKGIKQGESCLSKLCDPEFKGRCLRSERMGNATYKYYSEYISAITAERRIEEVRSVVADQFSGVSQMLLSLASDFDTDERFDAAAASRISAALKNINVIVKECGVRLDKNDRMSIEARIKTRHDTVLNKASIMHALCAACDRDFDVPCITHAEGDTWLAASEHAVFTADIGVHQICSENSAVCGDAYEYFFDGKGRLIMILSDGMGTGGRAAVDGAMATGLMSRLLKAGFGYESALKILNSSMLFKSTDESTATLDIVAIDLFSGKTELLKAGAAPTLIRRSGKSSKAQSSSLPAGILRNIGFDKAVITLKRGDIVLMLSDGAVSEGTDWISAELEAWREGDANNLARRISECAKRRRTDKHEDDITVIAAILERTA